ncbi:AMP-binding protein [Streptomyces sp. M19]
MRPGDRIGLLLDQAVPAYTGMLAALKANAAYVPLDTGFPDDRLSYIIEDAGVTTVLSLSHLGERLARLPADAVHLDTLGPRLAELDGGRLTADEKGKPADELCYVIYTSGSTGRPKGWPSTTRASATSSVRPRRSTASPRGTGSTRG